MDTPIWKLFLRRLCASTGMSVSLAAISGCDADQLTFMSNLRPNDNLIVRLGNVYENHSSRTTQSDISKHFAKAERVLPVWERVVENIHKQNSLAEFENVKIAASFGSCDVNIYVDRQYEPQGIRIACADVSRSLSETLPETNYNFDNGEFVAIHTDGRSQPLYGHVVFLGNYSYFIPMM